MKQGEAFRMELIDAVEGVTFATTADPVLKMSDNGTAVIVAEGVGSSEIQRSKRTVNVLMYVSVEVYPRLKRRAWAAVANGTASDHPMNQRPRSASRRAGLCSFCPHVRIRRTLH